MIFLKIAIIEDESNEQNKLLKLLEEQNSEELKLQIEVFSSAVDFLKEFQANYDIIFLDIRMPYVDGMSCAERIRKLDKKVILVFVTSLAQYAIQGYSVNAFDYILKPVQEGSFNIKFTRILDYYIQNVSKHFISLPSENGLIKIDINDIYYFEAAEHAARNYYVARVFYGRQHLLYRRMKNILVVHRGVEQFHPDVQSVLVRLHLCARVVRHHAVFLHNFEHAASHCAD